MDIIAANSTLLLILACGFGLYMAWGIGANDVANAMGTSVGARALTLKQAILIAVVFEFCGAFLAGGEVTSTIRKGIIDPAQFTHIPDQFVLGMIAALLAAATWLMIASLKGWPVSTTHAIVGAIVGFGAVVISTDAVNWGKVLTIVASWIVSPAIAGSLAYGLYYSVKRLILQHDDATVRAIRYVPLYMWLVGFMISMVTLLKGLKHVGLHLVLGTGSAFLDAALLSMVVGFAVAGVGVVLLRQLVQRRGGANLEAIFGILMVFTACSMAFAHGSNDVANAVGPLAAVVQTLQSGGNIVAKSAMPPWVLLMGSVGIIIGLASYGWRVIQTIGTKITELTPSRGFAAELAAACTVVFASGTGLPISTTHTLVGAVLGVGLARGGVAAIDVRMMRSIVVSWVVTLPFAGLAAVVFYYLLRGLLL
jgi:PiT family inorganic phosphate transporter